MMLAEYVEPACACGHEEMDHHVAGPDDGHYRSCKLQGCACESFAHKPWCSACLDHTSIEVDANLTDEREPEVVTIPCDECPRCSCGVELLYHEGLTPVSVLELDGNAWAPACWEAFQTAERASDYARARAEEAEDRANLHRGIAAGLIAMSPVLALVALLWWLR